MVSPPNLRIYSLPKFSIENPYGAAQRFLERNDLPSTYVDQVVEFIQNNTAGVNLGSGGNDEYVDPFTGKYYIVYYYVNYD